MKNETRLKNLYLLVHEHSSRAAVAEKINISHTEITGYFNNKHSSIPDHLARKIEEAFDKPDGWMDRKNYDLKLSQAEHELLALFSEMSHKNKNLSISILRSIQDVERDNG